MAGLVGGSLAELLLTEEADDDEEAEAEESDDRVEPASDTVDCVRSWRWRRW